MTTPEERQPVVVHCRTCQIAWVAVYLPMPLDAAARALKRATCPKCGSRKQVYMGPGPVTEEQAS